MTDPVKISRKIWRVSTTAPRSRACHAARPVCTLRSIAVRLMRVTVRAEGLGGRFKWEIAAERELARNKISDHRAEFERRRREYFYIDLYPENAERFDVRFEDCEPRQKGEVGGDSDD
jgi:hypothetical protein